MSIYFNIKKIRIFSLAVLLVAFTGIFLATRTSDVKAAPSTFEVNSINDGSDANNGDGICETSTPGECTLRAAIEQANTNGNPSDQDKVTFDISGTGLHTIVSGAQFSISQSLEIDGYSQLGSSANSQAWPSPFDGTLTIEIDSSAIANNMNSFSIGSDDVTIRGLIANSSPTAEFIIQGARDNVRFYGNYIGTDASGLVDGGSNRAIFDLDGGSNTVLGGSLPEERNIVTSDFGAISTYSDNVVIQGNYIGVGADGVTPLPPSVSMNTYSTDIWGNNALVGGTSPGEGNSIENANNFSALNFDSSTNSQVLGNRFVGNYSALRIGGDSSGTIVGDGTVAGRNIISGNDILSVLPCCEQALGETVVLDNTQGVSIKGNYIGVSEDGTSALGNGKSGVYIIDSTNISIGGENAGDANIIANSGQDGITVNGNSSQISILGNSIYANSGLGVDLSNNGVTTNDVLDPDTGPNDLLNYPKLLVPVEEGGDTNISYRLDVPAGDYRVEFFSNSSYDPSGNGEGETLIGSDTVTSLGSGAQLFSTTILNDGHQNISANVTEIDLLTTSGYGPTSEFSSEPFTDENMSISKTIVDQDTIVTDGTVQYVVTITNTGGDPIDLTQYSAVDNGDPLNTSLFNEIYPNNLTLDSVSGDADCSEQNPSSDYGTMFSSHTNSTVASCEYTGLSSSLNPGATMAFTLTFSLTDPTLSAFTNYVLVVPATTDGDYSQYQDAVSGGGDIIDVLTNNIDNLASAITTAPEADVSLVKQLLTDPADVEAGGTLGYQLTYTNNGEDPLYLGANKDTNGSNPLFLDFLHPDLSVNPGNIAFEDVSPGIDLLNTNNPDMTCLKLDPSLAALYFGLVTYSDHSVIACWYTGSDNSLASGDSYTVSFELDVAGDSSLDFANYAYAYPSLGGSSDPDEETIDDAVAGGADVLDGLIKSLPTAEINNFAVSVLPIDLTVSSEVVDPPASISEGTPIKLKVALQNNGPASFRFSDYPNFVSAVFSTIISGTDVQFDGVEGDLLPCTNLGAGGAAFLGAAGQDHPDLENVTCVGAESNIVIAPGDSQDVTLLFSAKSTVSSSFSFYSLNASASSDPDIGPLFGAIFGASEDILDTLDNNNYSIASYTGTVVDSGNNTGGGNNQSGSNGGLSSTGQSAAISILVATVLAASSLLTYKKQQSNKSV